MDLLTRFSLCITPALWLGLVSCASDFDELQAQASWIRLEAPSDVVARTNFGAVVLGYEGQRFSDGEPISRVAVTGGPNSAHVVFDIWTAGASGLLEAEYSGCNELGREFNCAKGFGSALAHPTYFDASTFGQPAGERRDCIVTAATRSFSNTDLNAAGAGQLRFDCLSLGGTQQRIYGPGDDDHPYQIDYGAAIAAIPGAAQGMLLVSAPSAAVQEGRIRRLLQQGLGPLPVAIAPAELEEDAQFGKALEILALSDEERASFREFERLESEQALLAVAARDRVSVFAYGVTADGVAQAQALTCLNQTAVGNLALDRQSIDTSLFPSGGMALGRLRGEIVLAATRADGRVSIVEIRSGGQGCTDPEEALETLDFTNDAPSTGYGAAVELADLTGDGNDDLAVGAPLEALPEDESPSGFVHLYDVVNDRHVRARPSDLPTESEASESSESAFQSLVGAALGSVFAERNGTRRAELVVGAPGAGRAFILACSGLPGDGMLSGDDNSYCWPEH